MTTTTARAPRRDFAENRDALLLAARRLLNQDPDSSMETIAAEAGLSRRAIYGHFATRDELLRELVTTGSARIAGALDGVTDPDPVVRLALITAGVWRELTDVRVMVLLTVRGPLVVHTTAGLAPLRRAILDAIVDGQAAGSIRTDIDAARLARLVESTALDALVEASEPVSGIAAGQRMAVSLVLGVIGLGWRDAAAFLIAHPAILAKDPA